jgi:hypothetical protein
METGHWKQDIWDTTKAIFWELAILSVLINAFNVIIGADSLGVFISSFL